LKNLDPKWWAQILADPLFDEIDKAQPHLTSL
jgi:hypothetical protein